MFAKTRLALLVGWVTGQRGFSSAGAGNNKKRYGGCHLADAERGHEACHAGY